MRRVAADAWPAALQREATRDDSMDPGEILDLFRQIRVAERYGRRAPHKPLLLLWALARVQRRVPRLAHYSQVVEPALVGLLDRFGEGWRRRPNYPFWRLRGDGLWEVPGGSAFRLTSAGHVFVRDLRKFDARGGFTEPVYRALRSNPGLVHEAAAILLNEHFPSARHVPILTAVHLVPYPEPQPRETLDPGFHHLVLDAYDQRCAVCDFSLELGGEALALDAAHIMWPGAGGPDTVTNGLALCSTHRVTWHRGVISLEYGPTGCRILVSDQVTGRGDAFAQLHHLRGALLRPPADLALAPSPNYTEWHRRLVFQT